MANSRPRPSCATAAPPMTDERFTAAGANLTGTSKSAEGAADLVNPSHDENTVSWEVPITVPMPLTREFVAIVDGDTISGAAKVGSLATISFEGSRVWP